MSRGYTARNPITGAWLKTKAATDSYRTGFDAIFGKKEPAVPSDPAPAVDDGQLPVEGAGQSE